VIELVVYEQEDGVRPFEVWFTRVRDNMTKARILQQLRKVEAENLGDHAAVGAGVFELRMHFGPGYRIYCGRSGKRIVILLTGGNKSSQSNDIAAAKSYLEDWKRRTQA